MHQPPCILYIVCILWIGIGSISSKPSFFPFSKYKKQQSPQVSPGALFDWFLGM